MNAAQSSPALAGAFDAFLFAPVGEETNGMALSVLSALSRLGLDPWADAARLSCLPRDAAIAALGQSIARLPPGKWRSADTTDIATRLVALLPRPDGKPARAARVPTMPADWKRRTTLVLAVAVIGLAAYLLLGMVTRVEHHSAGGGVSVDSGRPRTR
jgi:hypothetical protein